MLRTFMYRDASHISLLMVPYTDKNKHSVPKQPFNDALRIYVLKNAQLLVFIFDYISCDATQNYLLLVLKIRILNNRILWCGPATISSSTPSWLNNIIITNLKNMLSSSGPRWSKRIRPSCAHACHKKRLKVFTPFWRLIWPFSRLLA